MTQNLVDLKCTYLQNWRWGLDYVDSSWVYTTKQRILSLQFFLTNIQCDFFSAAQTEKNSRKKLEKTRSVVWLFDPMSSLKFVFSKKATKIDEIFTVNLTLTTYVKSTVKMSSMNFIKSVLSRSKQPANS